MGLQQRQFRHGGTVLMPESRSDFCIVIVVDGLPADGMDAQLFGPCYAIASQPHTAENSKPADVEGGS